MLNRNSTQATNEILKTNTEAEDLRKLAISSETRVAKQAGRI